MSAWPIKDKVINMYQIIFNFKLVWNTRIDIKYFLISFSFQSFSLDVLHNNYTGYLSLHVLSFSEPNLEGLEQIFVKKTFFE